MTTITFTDSDAQATWEMFEATWAKCRAKAPAMLPALRSAFVGAAELDLEEMRSNGTDADVIDAHERLIQVVRDYVPPTSSHNFNSERCESAWHLFTLAYRVCQRREPETLEAFRNESRAYAARDYMRAIEEGASDEELEDHEKLVKAVKEYDGEQA